jgi:hypothetical protein
MSEYLNVTPLVLKKAPKTTLAFQVEGFGTSELKKQQQSDMMIFPNTFQTALARVI